MNLQLSHIICNWECIGQGDGGFIEQGDLEAHNENDNENGEDITEYEFGLIWNHRQ